MTNLVSCMAILAVIGAVCFAMAEGGAAAPEADDPNMMLAHNVYFTLNESTPEAREKLVAACKKYLVKHPGVAFFACGTVSDLSRPVNDRDFDVALHVFFKDRASHDKYQTAPDHLKFIEENKAGWKKVRVFDSVVEPASAE